MSWGFERGRVYNRRRDVHGKYGGQQQGGIITPSGHNVILIITGEEGLDHGYADRLREDGVFEYFGEGQVGDMPWVRGNLAIAEHLSNGKDLLLFRKTKDGVRFEGEMVCEGSHYQQAPDREGNTRRAIVFELRPLEAVVEAVEVQAADPSARDIGDLRKRAFAAAGPAQSARALRTIYQRSRDVRDYVLARAGSHCEGCGAAAPFVRPDGTPYLEPHHIRRVSDGGPDDPRFVIALCPNCHRRVHAAVDGVSYNSSLLAKMPLIEP